MWNRERTTIMFTRLRNSLFKLKQLELWQEACMSNVGTNRQMWSVVHILKFTVWQVVLQNTGDSLASVDSLELLFSPCASRGVSTWPVSILDPYKPTVNTSHSRFRYSQTWNAPGGLVSYTLKHRNFLKSWWSPGVDVFNLHRQMRVNLARFNFGS